MGRDPAVVSMEFLGPISGRQRIAVSSVDTLPPSGTGPCPWSPVGNYLNRSIAAMWQETVQNGRWWTWRSYLDGVEAGSTCVLGRDPGGRDPRPGRTFWRQQNTVRPWPWHWLQADVDRLPTFLTVGASRGSPPAGLLGRRFGEVVGFDASTSGSGPAKQTPRWTLPRPRHCVRTNVTLLAEEGAGRSRSGPGLRKNLASPRWCWQAGRGSDLMIGLLGGPTGWSRHARAMVGSLQGTGRRTQGGRMAGPGDPAPVPGIDPRTVARRRSAPGRRRGPARGLKPVLRRRLGDDWDAFDGDAPPGRDPVEVAVGSAGHRPGPRHPGRERALTGAGRTRKPLDGPRPA